MKNKVNRGNSKIRKRKWKRMKLSYNQNTQWKITLQSGTNS